ncbi:MAG: UpxY family transcription antiterminator [Algoriphagus sp.]|jgi:transcription termination/antitermination protein NusG|uniref:UpxY family transcription antiterminator n=1 Tax=Algoriphagus sp. TaxID=1872435 RepID=UPI0026278ECC|nr:UpxY family transcription antiterminator [Algoriphagus sp.]MDG1277808.1 UpxY family transcription antiterminator [Algoriphagus sp.]
MEELKWYVMYTASRSEKKVAERLKERGVEVYLPIVEELRQWSDRKKKVQKALFNGYVFVKTRRNELWECLQVPGAVKFVHFAGTHATVRDEVLDMIKRIVETGVAIETDGSEIEPGEKVKVIGGPLQNMTGEVIEKGNKDYFMIRIPGIHQNMLINLPRKFLEVILKPNP